MKTFKTIFVFRLEALGRLPLASLEAAVGGSSHLIQSQLILKSHLLTMRSISRFIKDNIHYDTDIAM